MTQQLARDEKYISSEIGMVGVLHTWGRNLSYHPHVHFLVPGGGLTPSGEWRSTSHNFFLPVKALLILFQAKMRDALKQTELFNAIPVSVWQTAWVVHCQPVGCGKRAFKYLAPYIFRVAISDRRILRCAAGKVTFRYRESDSGKWRTCSFTVFEFLHRFLQHVLPKGFVKVRYYGLFSPGKRNRLALCFEQLNHEEQRPGRKAASRKEPYELTCPGCGRRLRLVYRIQARARCPPV